MCFNVVLLSDRSFKGIKSDISSVQTTARSSSMPMHNHYRAEICRRSQSNDLCLPPTRKAAWETSMSFSTFEALSTRLNRTMIFFTGAGRPGSKHLDLMPLCVNAIISSPRYACALKTVRQSTPTHRCIWTFATLGCCRLSTYQDCERDSAVH